MAIYMELVVLGPGLAVAHEGAGAQITKASHPMIAS